jgi:hypothetical protein
MNAVGGELRFRLRLRLFFLRHWQKLFLWRFNSCLTMVRLRGGKEERAGGEGRKGKGEEGEGRERREKE